MPSLFSFNSRGFFISVGMVFSLLLVTASNSSMAAPTSDNDLLILYMKQDQCELLRRIIRTTTTINPEVMVYESIVYQSDCAFQEAKKFISLPSKRFSDILFSVISRQTNDYSIGGRPGGIYDEWLKVTENAIEAGANRDVSLNLLSRLCEWPNMKGAISYLIENSASLDYRRSFSLFVAGSRYLPTVQDEEISAREALIKSCPELLPQFQ